jgi:aminoglycoside phosphotransferase (APT) family kinase protein
MDIENSSELIPYLRSRGLIDPGDIPGICPLAGGVSSRTVLVEPSGQPPFVLKQALAKLRVAADWFSSPHRIHREAQGMRSLQHLAPAGTITEFRFEDFSEHIIAMAMVPRPHRTWKELLLSEPPVTRHFEDFAAILGQIHARSRGDRSLAHIFGDRIDFESLRIEPYYRYSAARLPEARSFLESLIKDTLDQRLALVHGDYSPKNILVHGNRLVLVDHEVIHFGDPAFDVGFSLTHLLAKALHCERFRREFLASARLYIRQYLQYVRGDGFDEGFEARACRHTVACLLARVDGRSPFEYLTDTERKLQRSAALKLMANMPANLSDLILHFEEVLACPLS